MGMAGPSAHEWLAAVTRRADYDAASDRLTVDGDDWRGLVRLARRALDLGDEADPPASGDWRVYRDPRYTGGWRTGIAATTTGQ